MGARRSVTHRAYPASKGGRGAYESAAFRKRRSAGTVSVRSRSFSEVKLRVSLPSAAGSIAATV